MKKYRFEFSRHADRLFGKLPKSIQKRIIVKLSDRYSYRIGDYRVVITQKDRGRLVILVVLTVGHRKEVYDDR